jgi:hypothetical protein
MSQILRQSTQVLVVIGPFVDVGDGFTPETGVTLSGADEAEILKANTSTTTSISGATWAAITGCDGWYALTMTTSLTDTVGPLTVMVNDDSVCLPVFARFQVIEEAAYDAMYAASASPAVAARQLSTGAVAKLEGGATALVLGACVAGSSTTEIRTNLTEATNDHYNGRVITFTSGALADQARPIADYNGTNKYITVVTLTESPAEGDAFVIS